MNPTTIKRQFDEKKSDESHVKLQKVLEKMQDNLHRVGKYVELSKMVISECCDKLQELHSQVAELESILKEKTDNDEQHSLDTSEEIKEKNQLQKISDQENIEDITAEGSEIADDFCNTSETNHYENERKKQKTNPKNDESCFIIQQTNDEYTAGPSQETSIEENNRPHSQDEDIMIVKEATDIIETYFAKDAAETALRNAEGVLSAQELKSFLFLTDEVEDPVHLAKVSFTRDIEGLHHQLMTFHSLLKVLNDDAEKESNISNSNSNRDLEVKVQRLIKTFQPVVNSNLNTRSEMPFLLFRRGLATQQLLRHF